VPIYLREYEDQELIEVLEQLKSEGPNISEIGRKALRLYLGLNGDVDSEKAFCRVIQLEKKANEMNKKISELKQSVLEKLNSEISKLFEELDKLNQELALLKQAYSQKTKSIEKADDKALVGIIKKVFEDIEQDPNILRFVDDPKRAIWARIWARLKAIAKQTGRKLSEHVLVVRSILTDS